MKKTVLAMAALLAAGVAQADSSVTLYGLVDAGLTFVNNEGGSNNIRMDSGVMNGNRWGLKGREELTDNLAGIFKVEGGFSLDNGNLGQGGRIFGRQAFAGIDIKNVGQVTVGRQYDFMANIGDYSVASNQFGTSYMLESSGLFHNDSGLGSRATGGRVDNSIKFESANMNGLSFGAMIGLGENAKDKKDGRALSAMVGFNGVPNLDMALAYTQVRATSPFVVFNNTTLGIGAIESKTDNFGIGAAYKLPYGGKINGLVTMTSADLKDVVSGNKLKAKANVYEVGYTHQLSNQLSAGVGYQYFDNRTAGFKKNDIHGASVAVDYAFSKRTDAYGVLAFNKSKEANGYYIPVDITGSGASDSKNQVAVRVGLRHRF